MTSSSHLIFGQPLPLAPSPIPVITDLSKLFPLMTWPKYINFCLVVFPTSASSSLICFLISSFLPYAVATFYANTTFRKLISWRVRTFFLSMLRSRRLHWATSAYANLLLRSKKYLFFRVVKVIFDFNWKQQKICNYLIHDMHLQFAC